MLFQPFFSCVCQQVVGWRLWLMECYLDIWSQRRMVAMMLVDMEFIFWMSVLRARQMTWNDYWDWEKVLLTFFKELFFFSKWHQFWLSCCCTFTWGIGGTSSFDLPSSRRATDLYLNLPYRQYCGIISVSFPILHPYPVLIWYQPTKNKHHFQRHLVGGPKVTPTNPPPAFWPGTSEVWSLLLPFSQWRGWHRCLWSRERFLVHLVAVHGYIARGKSRVPWSKDYSSQMCY